MTHAPDQRRILFITRKWPPAVGGMETYCAEYVRRLQASASVDLIALPGRPDGRAPGAFRIGLFGLQAALRILTGRGRHDVVHGGDLAVWPLVALAAAIGRARSAVLSVHGTDIAYGRSVAGEARAGSHKQIAYRAYLALFRRLAPRIRLIANSHATARLLTEAGFKRVHTVLLAAPPATRRDDAAPDRKAGPPGRPARPYVCFVGRLIERKGARWFIEHVLPMLDPDIMFCVAGPIEDPCEGAALEHPRVRYLGPVFGAALARLRAGAIATVLPNRPGDGPLDFEGFGLAAVEAARDGAVVIATAADGLCDAVRDGETGFLTAPGDARAMAARIAAVRAWSDDERAAFLANAAAVVRSAFGWDRVMQESVAVYDADPGEPAGPPPGAARAKRRRIQVRAS